MTKPNWEFDFAQLWESHFNVNGNTRPREYLIFRDFIRRLLQSEKEQAFMDGQNSKLLPPSVSEWKKQGEEYGFMKYWLKVELERMMKVIRPKEKEFKGWHTAHTTEEFVDLTERYGFNSALSELDKNYQNYLKKL